MAELINAKCPNCGAILELPSNLDRAFCMHCGGKVIIAKDVHVGKAAIACPECNGRGIWKCKGQEEIIPGFFGGGKIRVVSCGGTGECTSNWIVYDRDVCKNGKCSICGGKGKNWIFTCDFCRGTGICKTCNGTGECIFCNGEGKFKCKACNGTGFKVYQGE